MKRFPNVMARYAMDAGADHVRIEQRGRHPHLVGAVAGRPFRIVVAGTPSDWRALDQAKAQIRRILKGAYDRDR